MNPILKKMNYKGQQPVLVLNPPPEMQELLAGLGETRTQAQGKCAFALVFVRSQAEAEKDAAAAARCLEGDSPLWLAYPKGSSKKYSCDCSRNSLFGVLAKEKYRPVSQVALDADWSALRFRKIENVKSANGKKL